MVNIEDFIKRLEIILDYYALSASGFADKVGVQRSSLSHLLSGRNKPSLDLIMKIVQNFPEVDLYWILNGKGDFPKSEDDNLSSHDIDANKKNSIIEETKIDSSKVQPNLFSDATPISKNPVFENFSGNISNTGNMTHLKNDSTIDQIVIFYKNGSFKSYKPE